ncbi:MAG TPA: hypothetical protein VGJ00_07905 [Rhabdochlamydiaceae bacterium]
MSETSPTASFPCFANRRATGSSISLRSLSCASPRFAKGRVLVGRPCEALNPPTPHCTSDDVSCRLSYAAILLCDLKRQAAQACSFSHFVGPYSHVTSQSEQYILHADRHQVHL